MRTFLIHIYKVFRCNVWCLLLVLLQDENKNATEKTIKKFVKGNSLVRRGIDMLKQVKESMEEQDGSESEGGESDGEGGEGGGGEGEEEGRKKETR